MGVVFNWKDETPQKFVKYYSEGITEYIQGEFNKCELTFILMLLEQIELNVIPAIIVDAISIQNRGKYGPGGILPEKAVDGRSLLSA